MAIEQRIIGPPGTGKTATIARNVALAADRYGPEAVMVTSLTRAAAHEAAGRGLPIPRRNVGTMHHFAYVALDRPTLAETEEGVDSFNEAAPHFCRLSHRSATDGFEAFDSPDNLETAGDKALAMLNLYRACRKPRDLWREDVREFADAWTAWKWRSNRADFADLIEDAADLPCPIPARALFLDEAQDLSAAELHLARRWAESMDVLTIVGDADQAIFVWRGADPTGMSDPAISAERSRVLAQSYRVPRAVYRAALGWIEQLGSRRESISYFPRDADGRLAPHESTYRYPHRLVDDASSAALERRRVMILASCARMLEPTKARLREQGIPFANPYRRQRADWNPLYAPPGRTHASERILSFLTPRPEVSGRYWTVQDVWRWCEWLDAERSMTRGAKAEIKRAVQSDGGLESVDLLASAMQRWFTAETVAAAYRGDLAWWRDHVLASHQRALDYPLRVLERCGPAGLREPPRLTLGTIHSVKGGEADVVYVWPDISALAEYDMFTGGGSDSLVRMFYVAMSRAREELFLASPTYPAVSWGAAFAH